MRYQQPTREPTHHIARAVKAAFLSNDTVSWTVLPENSKLFPFKSRRREATNAEDQGRIT